MPRKSDRRPPDRWYHYLRYPRIFLTVIICAVVFALQIAFGIYVWLSR